MLYQIDTFTNDPFFGNPTVVYLENGEKKLSDDIKQNLAKELNQSITVFISKSEKADFRFEFYSPKKQVGLSGHGTIAGIWLLAEKEKIKSKKTKIKIETEEGIFTCELKWINDEIDKVYMILKKPRFREVEISKRKLADILGIRADKIESNEKLPLSIIDAGSPKLVVLISSKEMTDALVPKFDEVERLCRKHKVSGLVLYTFDTYLDGSNVYTRQFEPIRSLPEISVSGLANGALGAFLVERGFAQPGPVIIEQGESLDRASKVEVRVKVSKDKIQSVKIGGKCKLTLQIIPEENLLFK